MAPKDRPFSLVFFAQGYTTWDGLGLSRIFLKAFFRKQRMPLLNAIFCFVGLIYYGLGESFQAVSLWYMMCHIQSSHPRKIMQKQHEFYYSKDPNKRVGLTVFEIFGIFPQFYDLFFKNFFPVFPDKSMQGELFLQNKQACMHDYLGPQSTYKWHLAPSHSLVKKNKLDRSYLVDLKSVS